MEVTKIRLSAAELEMVSNSALILTKNSIFRKAFSLLEAAMEKMQDATEGVMKFPFNVSPKISKGENYEGLPFAILDFPRIAEAGNLCFVRSMFWWGNFFSSTLHISGKYKTDYEHHVLQSFHLLAEQDYFVCIAADQWGHHFRKDNYIKVNSISFHRFSEMINSTSFIKIARKHTLSEWEGMEEKLFNNWKFLSGLISETVK